MRICFFGGPGSGKSTTSAWIFSELKTRQVSVELVTEYVKSWSIEKRHVNEFDQVYFLGKQLNSEYRFLKHGIKNIVTDSPVLLSAIYADHLHKELDIGKHIREIALKYENSFPALNIFLNRKDKPYSMEGRWQTKDEAVVLDNLIKFQLKTLNDLYEIDYDNRAAILETVLNYVD